MCTYVVITDICVEPWANRWELEFSKLRQRTRASTSIEKEDILSNVVLDKIVMFDWEWRPCGQYEAQSA